MGRGYLETKMTTMTYRKAKREINRMVQQIRAISRAEDRQYLPGFRPSMLDALRRQRAALR